MVDLVYVGYRTITDTGEEVEMLLLYLPDVSPIFLSREDAEDQFPPTHYKWIKR